MQHLTIHPMHLTVACLAAAVGYYGCYCCCCRYYVLLQHP
jgi:hypothetical protein